MGGVLAVIFVSVAAFCGVIGGVVLYAGLRELRRANSLIEHGVRARGVVSGFRDVPSADGPTAFPVLRFRTADGADVEAVVGQGRGLRQVRFGQVVPLVYDARDPGHAALGTAVGSGGHIGAAFLTGLGSFFLLGALVFGAVALVAALAAR